MHPSSKYSTLPELRPNVKKHEATTLNRFKLSTEGFLFRPVVDPINRGYEFIFESSGARKAIKFHQIVFICFYQI